MEPPEKVSVLIVGAGPTGLGAATRLHQRSHPDWALIDEARALALLLSRRRGGADSRTAGGRGGRPRVHRCHARRLSIRHGRPRHLQPLPVLRRADRRGGAAGGRGARSAAVSAALRRDATSHPRQVGTGPAHWNTLERVSYVRLKGRWVAYPFQNNVAALETADQVACLTGLVEAKVRHATASAAPKDFDEWILRTQARAVPLDR